MKLLRGRVLIIPNEKADKIGSIWLPEQSKHDRNTGLVVLIGEDVPKEYDKRQVLFNQISRVPMVYEGLEAVLLHHYGDIIAFLS